MRGILVALVGNTLINGSQHMMRSKNRWRRLGFVAFGVGNVLNLIALALTSQSLCAALSAMQFISHVGFCWLFFGEAPTGRVVIGTILLISALVLIILCHTRTEGSQSPAEQLSNFVALFPVYTVGVLALSTALVMVFQKRYGYNPLPKGLLCGRTSSSNADSMSRGLLPLAIFISLSAAPGSLANVCGKVLSLEIGVVSAGAEPAFLRMFVVAVLGLILIVFWLRQLGRVLGLFPESWTIPFCQSCWIFWTMLSGGVIFREFEALSGEELAGFSFGMLVLFWGAFLQRPVTDSERKSLRHAPVDEVADQGIADPAADVADAADHELEGPARACVIGASAESPRSVDSP